MARPKKKEKLADESILIEASKALGRPVKAVQFAVGCDLVGSKMSMAASRNVEIVELEPGVVEVKSFTSKRKLVFHSNVKGYELFWEPGDEVRFIDKVKGLAARIDQLNQVSQLDGPDEV